MIENEDLMFGCLYGTNHSVLDLIREFNISRENYYSILGNCDGIAFMLCDEDLVEIHNYYLTQIIEQ